MKKVININFQGRVVPIEESAYEILKNYIESLTRYFAKEEGKEEIINDIEGRIGELFAETLKKGNTCINNDDTNRIIDSMGRPEDFEAEEGNVQNQLGSNNTTYTEAAKSYSQEDRGYNYTNEPKKLYRDENNKVLGGVCSGLANYFGLDPMVVRILSIILFFSFGIGFLAYIIIWVAVPSSATKVIGSKRKRLFRDGEDKIIGGVASGLSHYFGINVWIPRALFLIPFFSFIFKWGIFEFPDFFRLSFSPGSLIVYIILWLVLPEAKTSADKLEMKGEKVDFNSIKETIQNDMKGFAKKAEDWGNDINKKASNWGEDVKVKSEEFGNAMQERAQTVGDNIANKANTYSAQAGTIARKSSRGLGDIIMLVFKIFAYFVIGSALFGLVIGLFSLGVVFTGMLPLKDYIIRSGWQNVFAWGTLLLFIWVPVVGVITFIIRRLAKAKANSNIIRYTFSSLWTLGWVCLICLIASLSKDFKTRNTPFEEEISLSNPKVNKLELKTASLNSFYSNNIFDLEPFGSLEDDTAFVRNIWIRVMKSKDDSFHVQMLKKAYGQNRNAANILANKINYNITQNDTILLLDKGVNINTTDKFRNQHVIVTLYVPIGKKFKVTHNANWGKHHGGRVNFGFNDRDWDWNDRDREDGSFDYSSDVEYIMTNEGPKSVNKSTKNNRFEYNSDENNNEEDALDNYKQSREELQKEIDEKQIKIEEEKKLLEEKLRELNKAVDTTKRYKYTPITPKKFEQPKASVALDKLETKTQLRASDDWMNRLSI